VPYVRNTRMFSGRADGLLERQSEFESGASQPDIFIKLQ